MYHIYKLMNIRNRAYVIDRKGNKLFYGTEYQCKKFIQYMMEGETEDGQSENCIIKTESHSVSMDN